MLDDTGWATAAAANNHQIADMIHPDFVMPSNSKQESFDSVGGAGLS